jgi:hypothetical protein
MKIEVVALGTVERAGQPAIHYLPGTYDVPDDVGAALHAQGVLARDEAAAPPDGEAPPPDGETPPPGRKTKGA